MLLFSFYPLFSIRVLLLVAAFLPHHYGSNTSGTDAVVIAIASELAQPPPVGFGGKNTETKPILAKAAGADYDDSQAVGG